MAPSSSLQDRINAFENLGATLPPRNGGYRATDLPRSILEEPISPTASTFSTIAPFIPPHSLPSRSPSPSPPNLGRKSSLIDLKDWVVDDGPLTQTPRQNGKLSNGNTFGSTPSDWGYRVTSGSSAPLINLESPPKTKPLKVPPLPPRKPSFASLKDGSSSNGLRPPARSDSLTVEQHTYPPLNPDALRKGLGHAPASSISSFHSVSLSSDGGTIDVDSPSVSSFISTYPMDRQSSGTTDDTNSLNESFENVATPAMSPMSATTLSFDWGLAMSKAKAQQQGPPKLPQRPGSKPTPSPVLPSTLPPRSAPTSPRLTARSISSSSTVSTTTTRRAPPPPPPSLPPVIRFTPRSSRNSLASTSASDRASDRSSIMSTATTTSRTSISTHASTQATSKLSRPTPVPAAARKRYEAVFVNTIFQRRKAEKIAAKRKEAMLAPPGTRKSRQAAGWRGLSVDLITNPDDQYVLSGKEKEDDDVDLRGEVGPQERMDGFAVRLVWNSSNLETGKLRAIWNECDIAGQGSLDRDAFVKGMWRIDEELRRAQLTRQTSRLRPPPSHSHTRIILR